MARLAAGFQARGATTTLLTARWRADWPWEIEHHGVKVARMPHTPLRWWGTMTYMRAIERWLLYHRDEFDLVYVSMLKHDAFAALGAARKTGFPVVVRAEGAGLTGDCHWQIDARFGQRIKRRCQAADGLIAPSPAIERELIAAGYPRPRIHYLPNGVELPARGAWLANGPAQGQDGPNPLQRDVTSQLEARRSLAITRSELAASPTAPIAVYTGRLHAKKGLDRLIFAWAQVAKALPTARLWLVGEGEEQRALIELIGNLGLSGSVVLTGAFDDVEDFLSAADVFVLPSLEEGMSLSLLEAMSWGLPVVATDIAANRAIVNDGKEGRLVPPGDENRLATALIEIMSRPDDAATLGVRARERVGREFSLAGAIERHLTLFERLIAERRKARGG